MSREEDRLLDHSYDGIQEFDNPLPSWWKWIFWASIVYSFYYVLFYHVGIGPSIYDDFDRARVAHFAAQEAKFADLEVNGATIVQLSKDADLMGAMQNRFKGMCATCHGPDASGLAGPNLTDNHWVHGGQPMDIYATIRDGVKGKAMKSWLGDLGPAGVLTMSAYVESLRGLDRPGPRGNEGKFVDPASIVVESAPTPETPENPTEGTETGDPGTGD